MSWTKKNVHPGKIVSTSQEVEVMVLEIDGVKRRVSLGLKQCQRNPWEVFAETNPEGSQVEGEVKNITEFGLFVGLDGEIDGMVHLSDISWDERGEDAIQNFRKGDMVQGRRFRSGRSKKSASAYPSKHWVVTNSQRRQAA
jgi:small subunit ribosomal protein S1